MRRGTNIHSEVQVNTLKKLIMDVSCLSTQADGRAPAAEWQSQAARQSVNHGGDHKTEVGSIAPPSTQS